jgi:hypothetical protein
MIRSANKLFFCFQIVKKIRLGSYFIINGPEKHPTDSGKKTGSAGFVYKFFRLFAYRFTAVRQRKKKIRFYMNLYGKK